MKQQLQQLQQETDLETVLEVIQLFMHSAPSQLKQMHLLQKSSDNKKISEIAHAMKGNMAYLGSKQGWDQCAKIELLCRNDNNTCMNDELLLLTKHLQHMLAYLKQVLDTGKLE